MGSVLNILHVGRRSVNIRFSTEIARIDSFHSKGLHNER